ncbi:MAG: MFS transporter [Candidatus Hodarchaeales archaeon]
MSSSVNEKEVSGQNESSKEILLIAILTVIFFTASAYGVQRTILSTFTEETIPLNHWFINGGWVLVAFTLSGFGLFKSISGLLSGEITQRIGVRRVIILGVGSFIAGSIPLLISNGNSLLLALGNSLLGIGEGILYAAAMTYITDVSSHQRRAQWLGIMELSVYGGYSFGAILSGFISMISGSFGTPFFFSLIITIFAFILAFLFVKPVFVSQTEIELTKLRTPLKGETQSSGVIKLILRPTFIVTLFAGHIGKMTDGIIILYLPLLLSGSQLGYGLSIEQTGIITASFTLFWAITMPLSGRISDRIGRKIPVFLGLVLLAFSLIVLQWGNIPYIILFGVTAMGGIAAGLYYPILPSIAADVASDDIKPKIIGIYRSVKDLGYFTGPLFAGLVAQLWYDAGTSFLIVFRVPFVAISFLLILSAILLVLVRETHPGWGQFKTSLSHARLVEDCVVQATKGLIVYLEQLTMDDSEFKARIVKYSQKAKDLELQADRELEEIVRQTYQRLYKSPDAGNFLRFARRLDRSAGLVLGALYRIQIIPIDNIPPLIQEKLHDSAIAIRAMVQTTVDVLQVLEIKIDAVQSLYQTVQTKEKDLDLLYQIMNRHLYISASQMHFGMWYAIKDVVNMIEQAADSIEDAAEVINILSIKYRT